MSVGLVPGIPSVENTIDPLAGLAWELFCNLIDALELSVVLGDGQRAQQIWTSVQAVNADLMSFYQNLVTTTGSPNG